MGVTRLAILQALHPGLVVLATAHHLPHHNCISLRVRITHIQHRYHSSYLVGVQLPQPCLKPFQASGIRSANKNSLAISRLSW
jgi:hypothetical protein